MGFNPFWTSRFQQICSSSPYFFQPPLIPYSSSPPLGPYFSPPPLGPYFSPPPLTIFSHHHHMVLISYHHPLALISHHHSSSHSFPYHSLVLISPPTPWLLFLTNTHHPIVFITTPWPLNLITLSLSPTPYPSQKKTPLFPSHHPLIIPT